MDAKSWIGGCIQENDKLDAVNLYCYYFVQTACICSLDIVVLRFFYVGKDESEKIS